MRRALALAVLGLLAALGPGGPAHAAPPKGPDEGKALEKIADLWLQASSWFVGEGRGREARRAVEEAAAADPKFGSLDLFRKAAEAVGEGEGESPAAAERWRKTAQEAAKAYERLGTSDHDAKDDARFDGWVLKALDLDPSKARLAKAAGWVKQAAGNASRAVSAGRVLVRARELDPDPAAGKRWDALEAELARSDVALVKSPSHPMAAWLSLPKGGTGKDGAVLVAVEGAGCAFLGACRGFAGARGSRKVAVLTPVTLSNTNELKPETYPMYAPALLEEHGGNRVAFDMAGLEAVLAVLKARHGLSEKVSITGFSGGGNLCYSWTLRKPDRVVCSAPACANFQPGLAGDATAVEGGGPPVHVLTGEKDQHRDHVFGSKPGIEGQTDWAMEAFQRLGFTRVKRTMLPGVGHSACAPQVWAFVDEVGAAK